MLSIPRVKVWRMMIVIVHVNGDPEELTNTGEPTNGLAFVPSGAGRGHPAPWLSRQGVRRAVALAARADEGTFIGSVASATARRAPWHESQGAGWPRPAPEGMKASPFMGSPMFPQAPGGAIRPLGFRARRRGAPLVSIDTARAAPHTRLLALHLIGE